jgi:large subunit ribosomal protein L43
MSVRCARPLFRAQLSSRPANGHGAFIPQVRKLVFEFCNHGPSSSNTRTFLTKHLEDLARENPHVEIVVKQRNNKEPIVRGFYCTFYTSCVSLYDDLMCGYTVNNRDKVIPLNGFEVNGVQQKVQLLLDSSGAKIKPLKRRTVESTTEAARGIWSGLHVEEPFKI